MKFYTLGVYGTAEAEFFQKLRGGVTLEVTAYVLT